MKRCPSCERTYTDDALSFCPNDGTPLVADAPPASFDPQATIMASPPKVSAPSGPFDQPSSSSDWPSQSPAQQNDWTSQPPAQSSGWGGTTPGGYQPGSAAAGSGWQAPPPPPFPGAGGQEKGLAVASLICGIISLLCFTLAGPVAIILGFMALSREKSDPARYGGGKGMAYGGIITGSLATLIFVFIIILFLAGALSSGMR